MSVHQDEWGHLGLKAKSNYSSEEEKGARRDTDRVGELEKEKLTLEKCLYHYLEVLWLTIYSFLFFPSKESFGLLTNAFVRVVSFFLCRGCGLEEVDEGDSSQQGYTSRKGP